MHMDTCISIKNRGCRKILCLLFPVLSFFKQMWRYIHDNTKFWTPLSEVFTSTLSLYRSVYKTISYSPIDSYLHLTIQQSLNGDQINICSIKMITGRERKALPDRWHRFCQSLLMVLFGHKERLLQCFEVELLWKPLANHMQSWIWHHPSQVSGIVTRISGIWFHLRYIQTQNSAFKTWLALSIPAFCHVFGN